MEVALATTFAAGLVTFFTPCVLPMIPIYLSALVGGQSVGSVPRGRLMRRAGAFILGFVLVFALMGLGAGGLGEFLQANRAPVMLVGAVLVLVFALQFLEVIQIPMMMRTMRVNEGGWLSKLKGFDAFAMGIVFAAGWSPCVGPVLGTVLTYTASRTSDPYTGMLYLTTYGLGFATPMFLAAVFAEAGVRTLRSTNRFIPAFKKVGGALLIAVAAWMAFDGVQSLRSAAGPSTPIAANEQGRPVLVEFYKDGCPVCEGMETVVDAVGEACGGHIEVRKINLSEPENRHLVAEYGITGVPTFALLDERGTEQARLYGAQSGDTIRGAIQTLVVADCSGTAPLPAAPSKEGAACDETAEGATACEG
jgi:cytochrome c-type biogenesis protein